MTPARTTATAAGPIGRGLVVVWVLLLALVALPCAAMADADSACGHCAEHAAGHGDGGPHQADTCLHCDTDSLAGPLPAEDRAPVLAALVQAPAATAVLVAAAPGIRLPAAEPRPPATPAYLTTRRLRL